MTAAKHHPTRSETRLITADDSPVPSRCLLLEGTGIPDCDEFYVAIHALEGVVQLLRLALRRSGRADEKLGPVEKTWTYRKDHGSWEWRVRALVPHSITASSVELAKHLLGRTRQTEAIALVSISGVTIH